MDELPEVTPKMIAAAGDTVLGHALRRAAEADDDPAGVIAVHDSYL